MKGQKILHILPSVTVFVFSTQPTWAEAANANGVNTLSDGMAIATQSGALPMAQNGISVAKNTFTRVLTQEAANKTLSNGFPTGGILHRSIMAQVTNITKQNQNNGIKVIGKTGAIVGKTTISKNQTALNLTPKKSQLIQTLKSRSSNGKHDRNTKATENWRWKLSSALKETSPQIKQSSLEGRSPLELSSVQTTQRSAKLLQVPDKKANTIGSSVNPGENTNSALPRFSGLISPISTKQNLSVADKIAQDNQILPASPAGLPINNTSQPPDYLNPNPNPLQYPTRPEEVDIKGIQPISLDQALELAKQNNRELQISLLELERAQAAVREAQASLYPTIDLNANLTNSGANTLFGEDPQPTPFNPDPDTTTTSFSTQAQLVYNVYTNGVRSSQIGQAEERQRLQQLDVERLSEEIRLNVATEYFDLQQADEEVRIASAAVENARASLRDAEALERAGVGTRFDVLRTQVNLANSQQDLTNAISSQQVARRRLATRLSLAQSVGISAADPVKLAGLWNPTLEESIVLAYQNRPELQQQLAQRNINQFDRRLALAQRGPQVSLVASYALQDQFDDNTSTGDNYSLGIQANLNLYDGGQARARAAQAEANVKISETQFADTRNQIRFQVEQAYSSLNSNLENVQTSNAALDQARESLRLARLRFQAGVGTQLEVIDAENALTRAEGNRVRAILDYNRALASLQRSVTSRGLR